MSAVPESQYISPEQYLLDEQNRPEGEKYEYVNGRIYAMAGASRNHNRTSGALFARLYNHLENTNCEVFQSDMKVGFPVKDDDSRYYYPDLQVSCGDEDEAYYNRSPCLIIEVLSDSTAKTDRTEKLLSYQRIPGLQEYVLCSQDSPHIEVYRKRVDWGVELFTAGQNFTLESVELEIAVDDIYRFLRD